MRIKPVRSIQPLIPPTFSQEDISFYKWLAGFLDGDGYFAFYEKRDEPSLKIAQATWNLHLLELLKAKFGGCINKIKTEGESNSYRYVLTKRDKLIELLHGMNGYIRATSRTIQFKKLCNFYNITWIEPSIFIEPNDEYFSGIFDADGSIVLNVAPKTNYPRMSFSMSSKYEDDIKLFKCLFKGNIILRKTEICYNWRIAGKEEILFAQKCFGKQLKSNKLIRANLIQLFYELKEERAYKDNSPRNEDWKEFIQNWYNNEADIYRKDCKGRPYTQEARDLKDAKNKFKRNLEDMVNTIVLNAAKSKT
jgi:hypothetical protein